MKKTALCLLAVALLTSVPGCSKSSDDPSKPGEQQSFVYVTSVDLKRDSLNIFLLKNETFDLSKCSFVTTKSNGEVITNALTSDMIKEFDSSAYGEQRAKIEFTSLAGKKTFFITYYVFENTIQRDFFKKINSFPYPNNLTVNDIDTFIQLGEEGRALSPSDKKFFISYYTFILDKTNKCEERLIQVYYGSKTNELDLYVATLNKASYSTENLNKINGYVKTFKTGEYDGLQDIIDAYNETITKIKAVERVETPIEDYRSNTIEGLKKNFRVELGAVEKDPESGKYNYNKTVKDYNLVDGISSIVTNFEAVVNASSDKDEIDRVYSETYSNVEKIFITKFSDDASATIPEIFAKTKEIESELVNSYEDITISVKGLFDSILVSYTDDNRWWTPEAYRPKTILEKAEGNLRRQTNIADLLKVYDALTYEMIRATLEKNLELYYSIHRVNNPAYDTTDKIYWNYIADHYGDSPDRSFVYDGPLSEYQGTTIGNSSTNSYRFAGSFYGSYREITQQGLLSRYTNIIKEIKPADLAVDHIDLNLDNAKVTYNMGEQLDVTGVVATIVYNDTRTEVHDLTNEMVSGTVDMSTAGSKLVTCKFSDTRLKAEQTVTFTIVVKSEDDKFNDIVYAINALPTITIPTEANIKPIEDVLALYDALTPEEQGTFQSTFPVEYARLRSDEEKCCEIYAKITTNTYIKQYEKYNSAVLSATDKENFDNVFVEMMLEAYKETTFAGVRADCAIFTLYTQTLTPDATLSLTEYKTKTLQFVDKLCEYEVNQYSGTLASVTSETVTRSVSTNEEIAAMIALFTTAVEAAETINDVNLAYAATIADLYPAVVSAIKVASDANLKQTMYDLRTTLAPLWNAKGDIIDLEGEGGSKFSTNYLDNGGYYCWYTPIAFMTGTLYEKITVGNLSTKYDISVKYDECLFDMSRVTMHRNILTTFSVMKKFGSQWPIIFCSPGFTYDGCLAEYEGTFFKDSSFRLWDKGWNPTLKADSIAELVKFYNEVITDYTK